MSNAIEIKNVSKRYSITQQGKKQNFDALKNLTLNIPKGKVLGIIGKNGSGKSTLLKILSRITYPTQGDVEIFGRLASLLEVGTGFHPELSGRENIFLNGSILGMKRAEIQTKFEEIVAFAGIERFLDTPVKHYSSGMYVRLAFAVAAHLSSAILLVDEVLAVGDAEFQKKCLQKMDDTTKQGGRTIVFVSHNMSAVRSLCDMVVWLENGVIKAQGAADEICDKYLAEQFAFAQMPLIERTDRKGTGALHFTELYWETNQENILYCGAPATLHVALSKTPKAYQNLFVRLNVFDSSGNFVTALKTENSGLKLDTLNKKQGLICQLKKLPFLAGDYSITANVFDANILVDGVEQAINFTVHEGNFFPEYPTKKRPGTGVEIEQQWTLKNTTSAV